MTEVKKRSYGVDVSSYQGTEVNYSSAKFVIIKVSEGTGYQNPKAKAQLVSAKKLGMLPMAYHFATFGANSSAAIKQADYAVISAKAFGLPKGSYLACDWETGDGNNVNGGKSASAKAIIAFMKEVKEKGYKPLLYSGAYLLRNNVDTSSVVKQFKDSLWVAAYPLGNGVACSSPNFGYFPSMNGVAIWQFTDNWKNYHIDGNINVLTLKNEEATKAPVKSTAKKEDKKVTTKKALSLHPIVKWNVDKPVVVITNETGAYVYTSSKLNKRRSDKLIKQGTMYELQAIEENSFKIGEGQYIDGRAAYVKANPIAYLDEKTAKVKIMLDHTHALDAPKSGSKQLELLPKGSTYRIVGRSGRFLKLKDKFKGKEAWVTGNRAYIIC